VTFSAADVSTRAGWPEWMDLKTACLYACVSDRTIREWIHRGTTALPVVQVRNKFLVRRSTLNDWLEAHRFRPAEDVDRIADEVMADLRKAA
jgi:excisionase family DNA binding protein